MKQRERGLCRGPGTWGWLCVITLMLLSSAPAQSQPVPPPPVFTAGQVSPEIWAAYRQAHKAQEDHDFPTALKLLTEVIGKAPDFFMPYVDRGMVYFQTDQLDKAAADLSKAVELGKSYPSIMYAYRLLGETYRKLNRPGDAVAVYTAYIAGVGAHDPEGVIERGEAYAQEHDGQAARADYEHALIMSPDNPKIYQLLSILDVQTSDWPQALKDSARLLAIKPGDTLGTMVQRAAAAHTSPP